MKSIILFFLTVLVIASCCMVIKPTEDNRTLNVRLVKTDNHLAEPNSCDGDITIENPRGTNVTYEWSHDTINHYQVSQLCSGHYKVTVTKDNKSRVSQIIIN